MIKNPWFRNIEFIKARAPMFIERLGYTLTGYEGAEASLIFGGSVWYQAFKPGVANLTYTIQLRRQGDTLKWVYERIINPEAAATNIIEVI